MFGASALLAVIRMLCSEFVAILSDVLLISAADLEHAVKRLKYIRYGVNSVHGRLLRTPTRHGK